MSEFDYFAENDPEAIDDQLFAEAEEADAREDLLRELNEMERDPHYFDFVPGYATEMDYMNAMEADDYLHEGDDIDF